MPNGQNQQSRNDKATEFQGGTVHLVDADSALADDDTTIASNESETTADGDWTITHDNVSGTTTLENAASIDFGQTSDFVIDQIVVESTDTAGNYLIDNDPSGDLDLSGDGTFVLETGNVTFELGGE